MHVQHYTESTAEQALTVAKNLISVYNIQSVSVDTVVTGICVYWSIFALQCAFVVYIPYSSIVSGMIELPNT